ncbi:MAG: hypothetical protein WC866_05945 [Patescibacteria group bacterium]|jgi:hypothetical protein
MSEDVQPPPNPPVQWTDEAKASLALLEDACRAAHFVVKPGFSFAPGEHWEAVLTLSGMIDTFDLVLWTTPALSELEQWRLRLVPQDETTGEIKSVIAGLALSEFAYLLRYVHAIVRVAKSIDDVRNGLRHAKDPRHAAARAQLLAHIDVLDTKPINTAGSS